ncbi:flagellar motor switch protein FliM [Geotalea sp. SG265]|uniref:flagellar motor switch protein FliM n=1 Tax=Geotalea sp. SG265 TaxID=2922867 RepID=UPI001FAF531B|nr:flagellar motor switch protein FliM [Geotalea sp. SG265]
MEKILTKEEIEALLNAVFDGSIEPAKELARSQGQVNTYDLFNSDAHKGLVPNLDIIYDGFIRYNRVNMSNRLGKMVEIKKEGARPYKFDDFLQSLPSPVCMALYKIEPLKGAALIAMDSPLVFSIVDSILGGVGAPTIPAGNRLFTPIELRLAEKVVKDALADMEKAWAPLLAVKMSVLRMEMNPRLVNIVPPEYQVVTMSLKIQIEETEGTMILAVPYMTVDPIRDKLKSGLQVDMMAVDPQWSFRLSEELKEAPLEVSVEMGKSTITLAELLNLAPGDMVMLEGNSRDELLIKVGGIQKFMGLPGVLGGNKAVQISRIFQGGSQGD